jgi:superfamily II DNA/RNA helicase
MPESFAALGVSAVAEQALAENGITAPFPIQSLVLPHALAGGDVLAQSPTGSGKTLAFGLALAERISPDAAVPAALVLVPTRELALQVSGELERIGRPKGLRNATVYGGVPLAAQAKRARSAHILVATPGRLRDLIDRRLVALDHVAILVLDEADRMLDMGFRPQVEQILRRLPRPRQTMLFSATLAGEVGELARAYTDNPSKFEVASPSVASEAAIAHAFVSVTAADKLDRLQELLDGDRGLALVFVRTKRGADRLAAKLAARGLNAAALHGDMTQPARERTLRRFRSGETPTLVATDVAARGLDLEAISHVINFDPPEDATGYVHRVGRTGRAGRSGQGVTLVLPEQQGEMSRVAARLGHKEQFESSGMRTAPPKLLYTSRNRRGSRW